MRNFRSYALSTAIAIAMVAGCSNVYSPGIAWKPALPNTASQTSSRTTRFESYYSCPASGPIKYVSDYNNNVINIYAGKFAGQAPCGVLTSHVSGPWGMFVQYGTHDLY